MADNPEISRADAVPGTLLTVGGLVLAASGGLMLAVAVQFLAWWSMPAPAVAALWVQALVGVVSLGVATFVADGRPWAAIVGTGLAPLIAVLGTSWAAWSLWNLSFTLFMLFTPPVALVASVLLPFTIKPALRCARARAFVSSERAGDGLFGSVG